MKQSELARYRLINQQLRKPVFASAAETVSWMCAIQAQDYAMAKWAIGCRTKNATDASVEKAFNEGKILRTHLLRPTWHFVVPEDIKWLLKLSAPQIKALSRYQHKKLGIDDTILKKSKKAIEKALTTHEKMTRAQLAVPLAAVGLNTNDARMTFYMMDAELDGLVCSAGRIGRQFGYTLLDRLVPAPDNHSCDEALTMLAQRYYQSRGPATVQDFAWWSGLNLADARKATEMNRENLICEDIDGKTYWLGGQGKGLPKPDRNIYLLPAFDEMAVGYKDRNATMPDDSDIMPAYGLGPVILASEKVAGTWKPVLKGNSRELAINLFANAEVSGETIAAAKRRFLAF